MNINVTSERAERKTDEYQFTITSVSSQTILIRIYLAWRFFSPSFTFCESPAYSPSLRQRNRGCKELINIQFCHGCLKMTTLKKKPARGLEANNKSPHCPLYALAFKVDTLNYCVKLGRCEFLLSV